MDKILSVSNIRKCNTSYGKYIVESEVERVAKRFERDKNNKLQMSEYTYKTINKEYFWRKKLAIAFLTETRLRINLKGDK